MNWGTNTRKLLTGDDEETARAIFEDVKQLACDEDGYWRLMIAEPDYRA